MPASLRDLLRRFDSIGGAGAQGVAVEDRLGKADLAHPEIGDRGTERRLADADADHQAEGEEAVDQALAELGLLGELLVEMQRLGVHRQGAEQHIVHLGDGAADRVLEDLPLFKLLEVQACHALSPCRVDE